MARLPFPDDRSVYSPAGGIWRTQPAGAVVQIFTDPDPTSEPPVPGAAADVLRSDGTAGPIIVDSNSQMAPWLGPADGATSLIVRVAGGPYWRVRAREDARIDSLIGRVAALEPGGSSAALWTVITKTSGYTATTGQFVLADATGGPFTVTPPSPVNGARFAAKKIDSSVNAVTIGATVDGTTSPTLIYQWGSMELVGDGSAWRRVVRPALGALVDYPVTTDGRYGPVVGSDAWLRLHAGGDLDALIVGSITRDANGAATGAGVVWPDGTSGMYTATVVSTAFPGAVDAYTVTYAGGTTRTVAQPAVTRDSTTGAVTSRPAMTVA